MKSLFKKAVAVTLALTVMFTLASCGEKEAKKETKESVVTKSASKGYESEKLNLRFTPPENYVMFNDSQIAAQMSGSKNVTCEMISEYKDGFPQVKVIVENVDSSVEEYFDGIKAQFAESNIEAEYSEYQDVTIANEQFLGFTSTVNGFYMQFYAKKTDSGMLCISLTTIPGENDGTEVLEAFSQY